MSDEGGTVLRLREVARALESMKEPFVVALQRGELQAELFRPQRIDTQEPHTRDEAYVVVEGRGEFVLGDRRFTFEAGDFLFVPAGVEHRFENFGESLTAWVIFYGPERASESRR